jgi:hypothetical protein
VDNDDVGEATVSLIDGLERLGYVAQRVAFVLEDGEIQRSSGSHFDHVLTFGSDYSHPESRFPNSAEIPFEWKSLTPEQLRKILWDNAVRLYGEP